MTEVKETKAQKVERLKREKLAWDHLDEIREFARQGRDLIPPEWTGTYFRSWGIYTQGMASESLVEKTGKGMRRSISWCASAFQMDCLPANKLGSLRIFRKSMAVA